MRVSVMTFPIVEHSDLSTDLPSIKTYLKKHLKFCTEMRTGGD